MGTPKNVYIEPTQILPLTTWTVKQVRSALENHDFGDMYASSQLVDQMRRDGQIHGDLGLRARTIASKSGLPFCVEPSEGVDDRRAKALAERVEGNWYSICTEATLEQVQHDAVMLGLAVGRIEWVLTAKEWWPRLIPLPPHGLRWNVRERVWRYVTGDGQQFIVTPGDGTWFLHTPHGDRSWLWGAVRALGLPWLMRTFAYRDWARYCEKHGLPVLKIREPYFATDDIEGQPGTTQASNFYQQFRNIGNEGVLRMPQGQGKDEGGWDAEWIEPSTLSYDAFQKFLAELRSLISVTLLGRDPLVQPKGGDGETAVHRVLAEYLAADAEPLTQSIRDQVLKPFVRYNVSADLEELAPWPRWDTRPVQDLNAKATMLSALGDALTKLRTNGVDTDSVLEEFQLEAMDADDPRMPSGSAVPTQDPTDQNAPANPDSGEPGDEEA